MITKERFVYLINFIKKQNEKQDKLCSVLEELSPQEYVNAFIYSEYEVELVKTLKQAMNIPEENDILEYWMYDLEYGKQYKEGCFSDENNQAIDIITAEKLYDYLTTIMEK